MTDTWGMKTKVMNIYDLNRKLISFGKKYVHYSTDRSRKNQRAEALSQGEPQILHVTKLQAKKKTIKKNLGHFTEKHMF